MYVNIILYINQGKIYIKYLCIINLRVVVWIMKSFDPLRTTGAMLQVTTDI